MIDKYTAQASTKEQAIEKGLKALGVTKDEAIIEVTNPGKKGFLGLGQRDAIVTVKRKNKTSIIENVFGENPLSTDREKKTDKNDHQEKNKNFEDKDKEADSSKPDKVLKETSEKVSNEPEISEKIKEEPKLNKSEESNQETDDFSDNEELDEEGIETVRYYLQKIVDKMGVEEAIVHLSRDGRRIQYNIETEDAGLIIGRHGKVLNGLQTLAQIQLHQQAESKLYAKVDAENYRDRRKKKIEQLARRTADKVKHTNRPVILEPMPAHERKQIHRYLNSYPHVQTHSEGKEPHRYLVVEPADD